jgi:hypothetical protein
MLSSPNNLRKIESRRMSWARHVTHMEDKSINAFYRENPRRRWKDDIKLDLTKIISQTLD